MLSRLSHLISAFLMSRFEGFVHSTVLFIIQEFLGKAKQALFMIISSFMFSILLAAGIVISLIEASSQYDTRGVIYFSALLISSLILTAVSALVLAVLFWPRQSLSQTQPSPQTAQANSTEDMTSLLLAEGLKYFRNRHPEKSRA